MSTTKCFTPGGIALSRAITFWYSVGLHTWSFLRSALQIRHVVSKAGIAHRNTLPAVEHEHPRLRTHICEEGVRREGHIWSRPADDDGLVRVVMVVQAVDLGCRQPCQ